MLRCKLEESSTMTMFYGIRYSCYCHKPLCNKGFGCTDGTRMLKVNIPGKVFLGKFYSRVQSSLSYPFQAAMVSFLLLFPGTVWI